jgi:Tfp pilus assembly protein PilF
MTMFEKAIELDPNYALAHAGLADLLNTNTNKGNKDSLLIALQIKEIQKAWQIDSTNDYVLYVRGTIEQSPLGNNENSFKYFKRQLK